MNPYPPQYIAECIDEDGVVHEVLLEPPWANITVLDILVGSPEILRYAQDVIEGMGCKGWTAVHVKATYNHGDRDDE